MNQWQAPKLSPHSPQRRAETFSQEIKEDPDLWGSLPARRQHCPQRKTLRFLQVLQERFEEPLLDSTGNNVIAKTDDSHSFDCQPQQHVRAVGDNRPLDLYLDPFAIDPKRPFV